MRETPLCEVREGLARLLVPDVPRRKGPGTDTGLPFYNPTMEKNRDMSILLLRAVVKSGHRVLDGLAATGAMGIRASLEVPGVQVTCNDRNPMAVELIRNNARLNGLELEAIENKSLQSLLSEKRYDFIDVDPFGTPVPFTDSAFQASLRGGIVAVSATDTAVLCGAQPRACNRRYEAKPLHIDCCKEIALRILLGHCARVAAQYEKAVRPLLSFGADHYLRTSVIVEQGARRAEESLANLGGVAFDRRSGRRWLTKERPEGVEWAGPLWIGGLCDADVVSRLTPLGQMRHETCLLVESLKAEVASPGLYVTTGFLARQLRCSPPKLNALLNGLRARGHEVTRTHFDPNGLKTDAAWDDLTATYRKLSS